MRRVWLFVAITCLWLTQPGGSQSRDPVTELSLPVGTSSISGTVTAEQTGRPVRSARVMVEGRVASNLTDLSMSRTVYTDASGNFSVPRLPAGRFTVSVTAEKYLSLNYGQRRHDGRGRTILLAEGQQLILQMSLQRGGVITGTVINPDGEPVPDISVKALRQDMSTGFLRIEEEDDAETDDRGVYRIYGLPPGEYLVMALPPWRDSHASEQSAEVLERLILSGRARLPAGPGLPSTVALRVGDQIPSASSARHLPVYAPSSLVPSGATRFTVKGGEVNSGADVVLRLTPAAILTGTVLAVDPAVKVNLLLVSDDPTLDGPSTESTQADRTGEFRFWNIPPGLYTLMAQTIPGPSKLSQVDGQYKWVPPEFTDAQKLWASIPVAVSDQSENRVSISLQPARSISGVVVFDNRNQPDLTRTALMVTLTATASSREIDRGLLPSAPVRPGGRFTLTGVLPGRYKLSLSGAHLKSAVVGGQETLDFALDFIGDRDVTDAVLTVTDSLSELSGTLLDAAGKPASDVTIVVVASDVRLCGPGSRRTFVTEPESNGRYTITGLPAGAYIVAVVTDLEPGAQYDADFLRLIRSVGIPVTIADGAKVTQNLRVK